MESVLIFPCRVEEVDCIREIQREVWLATYPDEANGITKKAIIAYFQDKNKTDTWISNVKQAIMRNESRGWVAKINKQIVGYSFAKKMKDKNRIMSLYVLPKYQQQGIGRKFMREMFDWFGNKNPIVLETAVYNAKAINFYKKFGFIENGLTQDNGAAQSTGIIIPETEMIRY